MPRVDSMAELNALLHPWDDADDARWVRNRTTNVGQHWAIERALLQPLLFAAVRCDGSDLATTSGCRTNARG